MDRLRCPDFPCGYSNCVIMEVGAEWSSAEGQRYKACVPLHPVAIQSSGVQSETGGDCGIPERSCMQFNTQSELSEVILVAFAPQLVTVFVSLT